MDVEFTLPDLGEGVEYGTIAKILVSVGDELEMDQSIVELETDKAVFEVPSSISGVIKEIFVQEGEDVKVGQKILTVSSKAEAVKKAVEKPAPAEKSAPAVEPEPVSPKEAAAEKAPEDAVPTKTAMQEMVPEATPASFVPLASQKPDEAAPAAPSVRRFAREIGIDINGVSGTGPGGRISIDDIKRHAKALSEQRAAFAAVPAGIPLEPLPDFAKWGEVAREPMNKVRRKTAEHLGHAWTTVAHVTHFEKADITQLEKFREDYGKKAEDAGGKLTLTAILLKIVSAALKVFPQFNASIDLARSEIVYKKYYHIGVAVDTDRGLLVPVVRDVDRKNIVELSVELTQMAQKARNKTISLEEMKGGCFTISNLGGIGGTGFTPIVNTPEVAILGVSRSRVEPLYVDGEFEGRLIVPLTLSYDHRLIDGADAARFLRWIVEAIEEPFKVLLEG
ncbi:MAG: biotin/lipoyl-binding protein [Candidatus Latescibacteria bacterium]|nr:biotin/lipoyl-binding protein [Candidatus Latescibacterota bacterium]NIM21162.1 biotin/lipoyl-binding protein [Candidatus Latescibacterota bacterium]NIM65297.1 biotin/lipoyl-binding protein [Candidatus Latescibacterota bacterium]NIO01812.1 biotin/lipoyl-binding protein [Candidatus Latescibacterota bacterium]NIO28329.1 biotin/lipoyl-binding protein [Candidatus Latescibacterota bacterium]